MDINAISGSTALSLAGKIPFPQVVMNLAPSGVERYMVDLVSFQKFSFGNGGGPLSFPNAPPVGRTLQQQSELFTHKILPSSLPFNEESKSETHLLC
jgi:hypothetical protein